ncbi:MAG: GNAT family N-acetyltransferase [Defluviitaleaceae bacterium]|nr:GNAT family N-acetyltransferase [Defluviitaleaceae bacterium]
MDITIRKMGDDEFREATRVARKAFGPTEGLFVFLSKTALVAISDEKIVGGVSYKVYNTGGKKIGFVSFLFTDPTFHGQGIGKRLLEDGIRLLWEEEGCDVLVTFVRDDNVASWGPFVKNGFVLASLPKIATLTGLPGMISLFFKSAYAMSIGHEFYIALRDEKSAASYKKEGGVGQIAGYALINVLLLVPFALRAGDTLAVIASIAFIFLGMVLAGYIGTLFSKRKWSFRLPSGGAFVYVLLAGTLRTVFPMIGCWYPDKYENTPQFRRDLALNAVAVWVFLLGIATAGILAGGSSKILAYASNIVSVLLALRCLPIPAFESSGFGRVLNWSKPVLGALVGASFIFVFVF